MSHVPRSMTPIDCQLGLREGTRYKIVPICTAKSTNYNMRHPSIIVATALLCACAFTAAENIRGKYSIQPLESVVKPLDSVVQPLESVTETNYMTMFNNQGHNPYSNAYQKKQQEVQKRYHEVTMERNKAAQYLKKLQRYQNEEEASAELKKKKSGGALKAIGGLLNYAWNMANPEGFAIDAVQKQNRDRQTNTLPNPSHYKHNQYVVQFRVPTTLKRGEVYPIRGPLQLDHNNRPYRKWAEITGGTPNGVPGGIGAIAWNMPRALFNLNRMDGRNPYIRRDCGKHFCVHKDATIRA
jgi:hypothetical protein